MSVCNLNVVKVQIRGMIGYQVQCWYRDCSDSLFEALAHAAVFQDRCRAERFLQKCGTRPSWQWDWSQWGKPVDHVPSPLDACGHPVSVYSVL